MPERFYLLVAGPRDAHDIAGRVWDDADKVLADHLLLTIVEGGCPTGADLFIRVWARDRALRGAAVELETYPAPWDVPELGKSAGPARYGFMAGLLVGRARAAAAMVYVYDPPRPGQGRGSAGTAAFAAHAGLDVWRRPI